MGSICVLPHFRSNATPQSVWELLPFLSPFKNFRSSQTYSGKTRTVIPPPPYLPHHSLIENSMVSSQTFEQTLPSLSSRSSTFHWCMTPDMRDWKFTILKLICSNRQNDLWYSFDPVNPLKRFPLGLCISYATEGFSHSFKDPNDDESLRFTFSPCLENHHHHPHSEFVFRLRLHRAISFCDVGTLRLMSTIVCSMIFKTQNRLESNIIYILFVLQYSDTWVKKRLF